MEQKDLDGLVSLVSIESLPDRYLLHNVPYNGVASVVDISKALLDNGRSHPQLDWIEMTRQGEWKLPPGPLYHAGCSALYANREHPDDTQRTLVTEVKDMLRSDFRANVIMMTSTRVRYAAQGQDTIIHDVGYENERRINDNIVGPDGYVNKDGNFDKALEALLGTGDCDNVQAVYSWLSGKQPYLWRFNKRLKQDTERALVLDRNGEWFGIGASDNLGYWRARGMVVRGAENSP